MAYKISGTISHDCDLIIVNADTKIIDKVAHVTAGSYEVGLLTAPTVHVLAAHPTKGTRSLGYIDAEYYSYVQPTFGVALKECQLNASYGSGSYFQKDTSSSVTGGQNSGSVGVAEFFVSFEKSILNGNKVELDIYGYSNDGSVTYQATIADGEYDRTSATDFVVASGFYPTKGAGVLHTFFDYNNWGFSRNTYSSGILDLSSSTQDYVTVFAGIASGSGRSGYIQLFNMVVKSPSNAIITQSDLTPSIVWPEGSVGGTNFDYGRVGTYNTVVSQ